MNRSNLRSFPTPATPATVAAEGELASLFDALLARGERDEESPDYELLEAAVDGGLEPFEAELFASRLAGDPVLEREFGDLVNLRDRLLDPQRGLLTVRRFAARRRADGRRWLGLAAAAILLAVVGLEVRHHGGITGNTARLEQPLFADSFEGGSTERWSN